MKKILLFFVCAISVNLYSQYYSLKKPSELNFLDPIIEKPKEFSFHEQKEYFNSKEFKIKSKLISDKLTEYNVNGNIISEKNDLFNKKITYTYTGKILTEKKTITIANKKNISKKEQQQDKEINRQTLNSVGSTMVSKSVYISDNREELETIDLDKNNKIIAFFYKDYKIDDASKKALISDNSYKVSYNNGKISEINSKNKTEKYYYERDLLIKKEYLEAASNLFSQDKKEVYSYHYDTRKNLIAIWRDETVSRNGNIDGHSFYRIDSASYDNKNRVIWQGSKNSFKTFKYDSKNNILEVSDSRDNKIYLKNEYVYNSQNQIEKASIIFYKNEKEEGRLFKNFIYNNDLLKEIQTGNDQKTVLDYNDKKDLIKVSEYRKPYQEKDKPPVDFRLDSETKYIWGTKSLSTENKYSSTKYTFY